MRISDWSSDVCSSDLRQARRGGISMHAHHHHDASEPELALPMPGRMGEHLDIARERQLQRIRAASERHRLAKRSEEHTSELQSLMRISYAVFCLKKKNKQQTPDIHPIEHLNKLN